VPSKTSGMPRPARVSAHLTGLLHVSIALLLAFSLSPAMAAEDAALYAAGEKLFKGNCASCHKPDKDMTGPALQGARARWEGQGDIYAWIKNSPAYLKTGNPYAQALFEKWNKSP